MVVEDFSRWCDCYLTQIRVGASRPSFSSGRMQSRQRSSMPVALPSPVPLTLGLRQLYSSSPENPNPDSSSRLTHIDSTGRASMVNVSDKTPTKRSATAVGRVYIPQVAYDLITSNNNHNTDDDSSEARANAKAKGKGDVLSVAQLAAIMGAKRTSDLIPLCHPLSLSHVSVNLITEEHSPKDDVPDKFNALHSILVEATVSCEGKTGVEMEALTAVSVGALTVWDMLKAVAGEKMVIGDIMVVRKAGGKSGDFTRN